jgi:hypothetical protein
LLAAAAVVTLPLVLLTALAWLAALVLLTALIGVLARLALVLIGTLIHVRHLKLLRCSYQSTVKPGAPQQCRSTSAKHPRLRTLPL